MANWNISIGRVPIVVWVISVTLPVLFFQLTGITRNVPVGNVGDCVGSMRVSGIVLILVIAGFFLSARSAASNVSLLDRYFDEFPDNEVVYLFASVASAVFVMTWPHFNDQVPGLMDTFFCVR